MSSDPAGTASARLIDAGRQAVARACASRWAPVAVVVLAWVVCIPGIFLGLVQDDLVHREFILAHLGGTLHAPWWDLFHLDVGGAERLAAATKTGIGAVPWWTDPELKVHLFRPFSVATQYLDYALWPQSPVAMHLHNVSWYLLLVTLVLRLYRRLLPWPSVALASAAIYAISDANVMCVAWIANRNGLIAAALGVAACNLHIGGQNGGRVRRALFVAAGVVLYGAALLSGESAIITLALLFAIAMWGGRSERWRELLMLLPYVAVTALWRLAYSAGGFGARASGAYIDPVATPLGFLAELPLRLTLLAWESLGLPYLSMMVVAGHRYASVLLGAAVILMLMFALWARRLLAKRSVGHPPVRLWLFAWLLGLVPLAASMPGERLLLLPSIGMAPLLVFVVRSAARRVAEGRIHAVGLTLVLLVHVAMPATLGLFRPVIDTHAFFNYERAWAQMQGLGELKGRTLVVVSAPTAFGTAFAAAHGRTFGLDTPAAILHLSSGTEPLTIHRLDARTLELRAPTRLVGLFDQIFRAPWSPIPEGYAVPYGSTVVRVTALGPTGWPSAIRLEAKQDLARARYLWSRYAGSDLIPFQLPAPGESVTVDGSRETRPR